MAKYSKERRPPPTPKRKNPWDTPPVPDMGDPTPDITFAAVGRALSQWERFEGELSELFAVLVGGEPTHAPAARAYGSVQSFRGRADMVEAAAEMFFALFPDYVEDASSPRYSNLQPQVTTLLRQARRFSARRNDIAHGVVYSPTWRSGDQKASALFPARYMTNRHEIRTPFDPKNPGSYPTYVYSSAEIDVFTAHFQALTDDANLLWFDVGVHRQIGLRDMREREEAEKKRRDELHKKRLALLRKYRARKTRS